MRADFVLISLIGSLCFTFNYHSGLLVKALESEWAVLSENIGLWIPTEIIHQEHDDKPEGEEEAGKLSILNLVHKV